MSVEEFKARHVGKLLIKRFEEPNPGSDTEPDWSRHFAQGVLVFAVRWELMFPNEPSVLRCLTCQCGTCKASHIAPQRAEFDSPRFMPGRLLTVGERRSARKMEYRPRRNNGHAHNF